MARTGLSGIQDAVALLVLVFAGIQVNVLLMDQTPVFRRLASSGGVDPLVIQMGSQCMIILLVVIAYVSFRERSTTSGSWRDTLGVTRPTTPTMMMGVMGALTTFAFSTLVMYAIPASDVTGSAVHRFLEMSIYDRALFSISIVLLAPLAEEMLYRGAVFATLSRSLGIPAASVIVTLLFVASHYTGVGGSEQASLSSLSQLSALGLVLILVRIRTGNLWPCVLAHCAYNVLCLAAVLI